VIAETPRSSLLQMVRSQIEARGLRDRRVLEAMLTVDRAEFVPASEKAYAYDDRPLPIGAGQTISQPYMVALMTAELELKGDERVLEIGTGCGYQTAILARLAREVWTIEVVPELVMDAWHTLERLGLSNIRFHVGDGTLGWPDESLFDRILGTAAAPDIPSPWIEELADPGVALLPIGPLGSQRLLKVTLRDGELTRREFCPCSFVLMRGRHGF